MPALRWPCVMPSGHHPPSVGQNAEHRGSTPLWNDCVQNWSCHDGLDITVWTSALVRPEPETPGFPFSTTLNYITVRASSSAAMTEPLNTSHTATRPSASPDASLRGKFSWADSHANFLESKIFAMCSSCASRSLRQLIHRDWFSVGTFAGRSDGAERPAECSGTP